MGWYKVPIIVSRRVFRYIKAKSSSDAWTKCGTGFPYGSDLEDVPLAENVIKGSEIEEVDELPSFTPKQVQYALMNSIPQVSVRVEANRLIADLGDLNDGRLYPFGR